VAFSKESQSLHLQGISTYTHETSWKIFQNLPVCFIFW